MAITREFVEDTPMTMQIAIRARDGFVLAGDTWNRITGDGISSRPVPSAVVNHSKVSTDDVNSVVVAIAGSSRDDDPAKEFCQYVSRRGPLPNDPREDFLEWGTRYYEQYKGWAFSLLLVDPKMKTDYIWSLRVGQDVQCAPHSMCMVNGDEHNPAILWPQYFKCYNRPLRTLEAAIQIAALTILTAGELNNFGVGDLEIWQYGTSARWSAVAPLEVDRIVDRFQKLKERWGQFVDGGL
jgi:hypothetical protein